MQCSQYERDHYAQLEQLADLKKLDPVEFERFIGTLFERMGYTVETTKISGDDGVDLILAKEGEKSVVQCKRYADQVGAAVVREFYGVMLHNHADQAFLVTTGLFSLPAQTWAQGKPLNLVDGHMLYEWIKMVKPPALDRPPMLPPPPIPKFSPAAIKKRAAWVAWAIIGGSFFLFALIIDLLQQAR